MPHVMCQSLILHFALTGLVKPKKYDWKDSNLALFGSDTEKQVKSETIFYQFVILVSHLPLIIRTTAAAIASGQGILKKGPTSVLSPLAVANGFVRPRPPCPWFRGPTGVSPPSGISIGSVERDQQTDTQTDVHATPSVPIGRILCNACGAA